MEAPQGLWALLRYLAARPEGFSTAEVVERSEFTRQQVGIACGTLRKKHRGLVVLRVSHKNARYFATEAQAATYLQKLRSPGRLTLKTPKGQAAAWKPGQEAVTPPHVKVQKLPGYSGPRNEAHEFPFLHTRKGL